jgi:uncharacterized protein (DUF302 family)
MTKRSLALWLVPLLAMTPVIQAADGLVSIPSPHSVASTIDRLTSALEAKGMGIFARIDHRAGAEQAGETLRPTELLIFGNPKVGTPLMLCGQSMAIDLPQKALAWEDAQGQVWLSYNEPVYLAQRHRLSGCEEAVAKITKALAGFTRQATAP